MGDQNAGYAALALHESHVGGEGLETLVCLGYPESSGPDQKGGQNHQEPFVGILNAVLLQASNGASESMNSRIQGIKIRSRGFRSKARYIQAIYFHFGGLALYPEGVGR